MPALIIPTAGSGLLVVEAGGSPAGPPGPPGSGSTIGVKDESTLLGTAFSTVTFTGAGVSATPSGGEAIVNIPGGGVAYKTRSALATAGNAASNLDDAYLTEVGREGKFVFHTASGFAARYGVALTTMVAADTLQGVYVAKASDTSGAGGAWVREAYWLTPFMAGGATNYKVGDRDTGVPPYGESKTPGITNAHPDWGVLVDARAACQWVFDMVKLHNGFRQLGGDFSGGLWGISKRGDGGAHDLDGLVIDQLGEYAARFIGGEFRGIGSGRHLIYVDEGQYSRFEGNWHVRSGSDTGSSYGYASRLWETGIWVRNSAMSRWGNIKVSGFSRWGIEFDPEYNLSDYNNNIGLRMERIYGNNNGSACDRAGNVFQLGFTASSRTGVSGSFAQRTHLTMAAGHEILRVDDIVRSPAGSYHVILEKAGNVISVWPWIISTAGSGTITSCHGGALRVRGKDVAGAGADHVTGVTNGATLDLTSVLHGTEWGNIIQEGGGLGLIIGTPNGIDLGHTIGHMHSEGNTLDLLSIGLVNSELLIGACSAWAGQDYGDPFKLTKVLAPNDGSALATTNGLPQVGIFINGTWYTSGPSLDGSAVSTKSRAYAPELSNNPGGNRIRKVQAAGAPYSVTLRYREPTDQFLRDSFVAELEVMGAGGVAPTDTITVTIHSTDVAAGVQFANGTTSSTYVIAGGQATGPVKLGFWLDTNGSTLRWLVFPIKGVRDSLFDVTTEYRVNGQKVIGTRGTTLPADATDLATALTLVNAIKARLKVTGGHGLVAD